MEYITEIIEMLPKIGYKQTDPTDDTMFEKRVKKTNQTDNTLFDEGLEIVNLNFMLYGVYVMCGNKSLGQYTFKKYYELLVLRLRKAKVKKLLYGLQK